jgi:molecular chaperone DnaK
MAYGLDRKKDETIVVFDLGGGTFDVSILQVDEEDGKRIFQVISTSGDTHLGGDDFDEALINYVADEFQKENEVDLRQDTMALQRLQEACEKAKKELSSTPQTDLNLPFIMVDASGPKHLQLTITRAKFEELIDDLVDRCKKPVLQALEDAKLSPSDIDEVVLVGGSTRVPKVRELVHSVFQKEPHQGVNPDEVVALGAAIQGGVLAGDRTDVLLLDVTPLTLGIETEGGIMTALVERNTTIPTKKTNTFSTAADNQPSVHLKVFQGERKMAAHNRLLGDFELDEIPPAPRGVPQIEVSFDIDQNGILSVKAKDLGTGVEKKVEIKESSGLSDDEISSMRQDAESNADEDRRQFELAEARNQAEHRCHGLEKQIRDLGEKLSDNDKQPLEEAITKTREIAKGEDTKAIQEAAAELEQVAQAFSKTLYEQPEGEADADAAAPEDADSGADDDTIDAEFEVKDSE